MMDVLNTVTGGAYQGLGTGKAKASKDALQAALEERDNKRKGRKANKQAATNAQATEEPESEERTVIPAFIFSEIAGVAGDDHEVIRQAQNSAGEGVPSTGGAHSAPAPDLGAPIDEPIDVPTGEPKCEPNAQPDDTPTGEHSAKAMGLHTSTPLSDPYLFETLPRLLEPSEYVLWISLYRISDENKQVTMSRKDMVEFTGRAINTIVRALNSLEKKGFISKKPVGQLGIRYTLKMKGR